MWCNWAGPGSLFHTWNDGVPNVNTTQVQGQTMERDAASGLFVPVTNRIQHAPVNSCDYTADLMAQKPGFVVSTTADTNAELESLTAAPIASELVDYGDPSIGTMPAITSPAAYTP
jgi:hypothetical protein